MNTSSDPRFRFEDHASGGRELAPLLERYHARPDVLVLALAKGGVIAAIEVARHLDAPLDVIVKKRVAVLAGRDGAFVSVAGNRLVSDEVRRRAERPAEGVDYAFADALTDFDQSELWCRGAKPPVRLANRCVIVVDNGIRSGGTMRIAVEALRALEAAEIIAATPAITDALRGETFGADLVMTARYFPALNNVAMAYRRFDVPRLEEIASLFERERAWARIE